ncbi:hypothetical protein R1sor_026320 [Riccia sorocarpa]|uniref:Uncharacterized protein n=1 Tax=Riccia sorocarpa TaxID=122646 RepID=A0ABD3GDW0_9MARC
MASPSPQGQVETAFSSWSSLITADLVSRRYVLMREGVEPGKPAEDITPEGYNVWTVVHESEGGASAVRCDILVFSNHKDQLALKPDYGQKKVSFADGVIDERNNRYITVQDEEREVGREAKDEIVAVKLDGDPNAPEVLITGMTFMFIRGSVPTARNYAGWSRGTLMCLGIKLQSGSVISQVTGTAMVAHLNYLPVLHLVMVQFICLSGKDERTGICIAGGDEGITEAPSEPRWSPAGSGVYQFWDYLTYLTCSFSVIEIPLSDIFGPIIAGEYVYISAGSTFHPSELRGPHEQFFRTLQDHIS